jgi:hypothetical protein
MRKNLLSTFLCGVMRTIAVTAVVLFSPAASAVEPVSLPPAEAVVAFVVSKGGEEVPVMVPELEALGLYRVKTKSPWEPGELTFEGVLFGDVVEHLGLADARAVRVQALDGYSQDVPREDWIDKPLILATRQDGKPLIRRTQGPSRLIYPLSEYPDYDTVVHDPRWVWLIKSIERVD